MNKFIEVTILRSNEPFKIAINVDTIVVVMPCANEGTTITLLQGSVTCKESYREIMQLILS